jgi:tetratricopeptide (TPR) repeat protein
MSIFLGVDLGHHSIVTASSSESEPLAVTVDANGLSNRSTPSIIGIENNRVIFGEEAETRLSSVPSKIVHSIPSQFHEGTTHGPYEMTTGDSVTLESSHLLSLFFKNYIDQVHAGKNLKFVTVSVPVNFTAEQTAVVVDAAHLSGLSSFDIIDHVDAAMTLLSRDAKNLQNSVLVIDSGYSQTSLGLLVNGAIVSKQSVPVGTRDFIQLIADKLLVNKDGFLAEIRESDPKFFFRLFKVCEKVLKDLSMLPSTIVDLSDYDESFEKHGLAKVCAKPITVSREKFESELMSNLGVKQLEKSMSDLKLLIKNSLRVEMVGGGSRVPFMSRLVSSVFAIDQIGRGMDGSAFAALGAALWSAGHRLWHASSRVKPEHQVRRSSLTDAFSVQETVQKIHEMEVKKLSRKNELESYLYQVKYWLNEDVKGKEMLPKSTIEPVMDSVWSWFQSVEDGEMETSMEGSEYGERFSQLKSVVETEGKAFFDSLESDKKRTEESLTANAEYLAASSSAHESAEEKRAKHENRPVTNEQCIKLAGKNKDEGNDLFKHGTVTDAMNRYMRCINLLATLPSKSTLTGEEKMQVDSILLASNLNMAQCVVKLTGTGSNLSQDEKDGLLKRGVACADSALQIDPSNAKAKYRKAVCLDRLRETEQAKKILDDALKTNPDDLDLKGLYDSIVASLKQQHEKSKKFFSRMFQ